MNESTMIMIIFRVNKLRLCAYKTMSCLFFASCFLLSLWISSHRQSEPNHTFHELHSKAIALPYNRHNSQLLMIRDWWNPSEGEREKSIWICTLRTTLDRWCCCEQTKKHLHWFLLEFRFAHLTTPADQRWVILININKCMEFCWQLE